MDRPSPSSRPNPLERFVFQDYELEPATGRLWREGEPVTLQAQPFKLLTLLVSVAGLRPGTVVTHDEIREALWGDRFVDTEQGIRFAVRQVRQVLGDDASDPRFVETVVGEGYRFVAPVARREAERHTASRNTPPRPWAGALVRGALGMLVALVAVTALIVHLGQGAVPAERAPRILVLPFEVVATGSDDDPRSQPEILGDLVSEEIVSALGHQLQGRLDPIAFASARRLQDPKDGASELAADFVVEGRIHRRDDGFRVTVHLVDANRRSQLWSTVYKREDLGTLLQMGQGIAEMVALHFTPTSGTGETSRTAVRGSVATAWSAETADLYTRARELMRDHLLYYSEESRERVYEAHRLLEEALALDPTVPVLHRELARIHILRWRDGYATTETAPAREAGLGARVQIPDEKRARQHLRTALLLDETSGDAHFLQGLVSLFWDLDLEGAEAAAARALDSNPSCSGAHYLAGTVATARGEKEVAIEALSRALSLNPLDETLRGSVGRQLFVLEDFEGARQVFREVEARIPEPRVCLTCLQLLVWIELESGDPAAAVTHAARELDRYRDLLSSKGEAALPPVLDPASPEESLQRYWEWRLERLPEGQFLVERAALLVGLGEPDRALTYLHRASLERGDLTRIYLPRDPRFKTLRDDPRFREVAAAILRTEERMADRTPRPEAALGQLDG